MPRMWLASAPPPGQQASLLRLTHCLLVCMDPADNENNAAGTLSAFTGPHSRCRTRHPHKLAPPPHGADAVCTQPEQPKLCTTTALYFLLLLVLITVPCFCQESRRRPGRRWTRHGWSGGAGGGEGEQAHMLSNPARQLCTAKRACHSKCVGVTISNKEEDSKEARRGWFG